MLSEELLKKVKRLEITTRRIVNDVMSGQYKSHFKGQGVQFSEHRLYVPGDDIRHMDWKASARVREPLIKKFEEERQITVFLVVDVSGSQQFGSVDKSKGEILAEIAAMITYAASQTGDRVGVLLFGGKVERIIPPQKGRHHLLKVIHAILSHRAETLGTNLKAALESTNKIMKQGGIVFVLSDLIAEGYETILKKLARKHDVVVVHGVDKRELEVPALGYTMFFDPETNEECFVDTGSYAFKKWIQDRNTLFEKDIKGMFRTRKIEELLITTGEDYGEAVVRFFRARARRRR